MKTSNQLSEDSGRTTGLAVTALVLPPKSFVRMFKPRFAALVEAGTKTQTVRPAPSRMPKAGDKLSLRTWTGKPYRSKQRVLREAVVERVAHCEITETSVILNSYAEPCDDFARADGFRDFFDMQNWFRETHGLPFEGIAIFWQNTHAETGPRQDAAPKRPIA